MIDLRGRVANLSPEQRALLGSKLAKSVPVNASRASTEAIAIVSVAASPSGAPGTTVGGGLRSTVQLQVAGVRSGEPKRSAHRHPQRVSSRGQPGHRERRPAWDRSGVVEPAVEARVGLVAEEEEARVGGA